jgi:hypothetical protein
MINYALNLKVNPFKQPIGLKSQSILLGSCFTEHLFNRLKTYQLKVALGPNGTVFNPLSLAKPFLLAINAETYQANDIIANQGLFFSKHHHGKYAHAKAETLLHQIQSEQSAFESNLSQTQYIVVTFGSAFVYERIQDQHIYANCHKLPANQFKKYLLSIDQIVETWEAIIIAMKIKFPQIQWVFTVSPVKHLKDGVHENNLSKSVLLLAIQTLQNRQSQLTYFPAYELVNDDLRDYRFYANDGAHPSEQAIEYVMKTFKAAAFDEQAQSFMALMDKYLQMQQHKRLHEVSEASKLLDQNLEVLKNQLIQTYQISL